MLSYRLKALSFAAALGLTLAAAGTLVSPARAADETITFVAWGGTTQDMQMASWATEFTKQTGIKVLRDGPTDYGKLKAMVDSGNVVWDVVDVEADFAFRAAEQGLLEPIDFTIVKKDGLDPRWTFKYGTGSFYYAFVLAYNKKVFGSNPPQTWADFFDTKKFPQKRSIIGWPTTGVIEMALLADGVPANKLYPLDLERAFKKLASIKDKIVFWNSGAESQQLLASGQAPICFCWDTRVSVMLAEKDPPPVAISWAQNITTADILVVPKGSKHKEAAMKFIAVATSPEAQARLAKSALLSPINTKATGLIDKGTLPQLAVGHADSQIEIDLAYWVKHGPEVTDGWNKWKVQ